MNYYSQYIREREWTSALIRVISVRLKIKKKIPIYIYVYTFVTKRLVELSSLNFNTVVALISNANANKTTKRGASENRRGRKRKRERGRRMRLIGNSQREAPHRERAWRDICTSRHDSIRMGEYTGDCVAANIRELKNRGSQTLQF